MVYQLRSVYGLCVHEPKEGKMEELEVEKIVPLHFLLAMRLFLVASMS